MAKIKFDELRKPIKHRHIRGRQFSQLAKQVAAALDRDAVEICEKLEEALKAIQIAEEFRGESAAARAKHSTSSTKPRGLQNAAEPALNQAKRT